MGSFTMRTTEEFEDDLSILCNAVQLDNTRLNKTQAVQLAVAHLANTYRCAWDYKDVQHNYAPELVSYRYCTDNNVLSETPEVPGKDFTERKVL